MVELALSAASPVVGAVLKKLASGLWRELGLMRSVYTDLENLQNDLSGIENVLDGAEKKSDPLQGWLKKLRDAAFDADDVVDELHTEALRRRMERVQDHMTGKVRDFFSSNNPIAFRYKMARKIKEVGERIDKITKKIGDFNLTGTSDSDKKLASVDRETVSSMIESEIYGRDDDKKKVIEFLVDKDNDKNISILPIVGLGGVGKTTLAQLVYNDERIKGRFELRMWVCVGESFDVKMVMQKMIELVEKEQRNFSSLEAMSSLLEEKLRAKRLLLVLDDLWDDDESKWDKIISLFIHAQSGSKIIITTRSRIVASITGTISPYELRGLGSDDCWALFKQKAFGLGRLEETQPLVDIGKEIVKKCGGSPLAAKILGSLMGSRGGEEEAWLAIRDSEIWRLPIEEVGILPILKLSYDHLPSHLKRCFTYCSVFPKDYQFQIKRLIQLWMAEGLIDSSETSQNAEDIGKQYFDSLLWRSFFQDVEMDEYNNIYRCKMHDLVHDLACSLTKGESLVMEMGRENILHECRYLSVVLDDVPSITSIYEAKKLRSLLLWRQWLDYGSCGADEIFFNITKKFTQIRALDLSGSGIQKLSDRMGRLKQLRFLDLSNTRITTLPTSITRLYNLQTLNLRGCDRLRELPEGISTLSNLRHLNISFCYGLSCMPRYLGRLSSLETLSMFIVGRENGRTIVELQHLNSIRGELEIKNLHNVKDANEAMQANLGAKSRLNYLTLQWNENLDEAREPSCTEVEVAAGVFERLQPHHNLKKLDIIGYMGIRLPNWMARTILPDGLGHLTALQDLYIGNCPQLAMLPDGLGHLTALQVLCIENCPQLAVLPDGLGHLTALQVLCIENCPQLAVLPDGLGHLTALQLLSIYGCPQLAMLPDGLGHLTALQDLRIDNCPQLAVLPDGLGHLTALQDLSIDDCPQLAMLPDGLGHLTALQNLYIGNCPQLAVLPDGLGHLTALQDLSIDNCPQLAVLPDGLGHLTALRKLYIGHCPQLAVLPDGLGHLTALQYLRIVDCPQLAVLPDGLGHLTALQLLSIYGCPQLAMLSDGLGHLTALQNLYIDNCPQLAVLPDGLGHLTALQNLSIDNCPQLAVLPDGLGHLTALRKLNIGHCPQLAVLPDGLRDLSALQSLYISSCPQLARRCKRETGEDWHKIAHIPNVEIWPKEDGEESSKPSKFLSQFGCARCTGRS